MSECAISGCIKPVLGRGWCRKHYTRWYRHGDPKKTLVNMKPVTWEYMLANSKKNGSCIEWQKARSSGYGRVNNNGQYTRTHRLSYELHYGEIPQGLCVLHRCDNRICINPRHLFLGTQADNIADMVKKGRQKARHLTPDRVREIRNAKGTQIEIADMFGVSFSTVSRILTGTTYRGVK